MPFLYRRARLVDLPLLSLSLVLPQVSHSVSDFLLRGLRHCLLVRLDAATLVD